MGGAAVKLWGQAARAVLAGWRSWIAAASLLAGAFGGAVLWLAAPVASAWHIGLHAAYALGALGFLWFALRLVRRRFAPEGIRMRRVLQRGEFWGAVAVYALVALWLPLRLVTWVPRLETLAAQAWSAGARFLLAWALLTAGICWMTACLGLLSEEGRDAEAVPAGQRENPAAG